MNNNTKIRLHLSKNLFESIAKEILAESKVNGGGAYTVAVKAPKQSKSIKEVDAVADTDKMKKMEEVDAVRDTESMRRMHEMSSKEKMAKGLYKEDAGALQPGENVTWLDGHQREYKGVIQSQEGGDYYKVKITDAPAGGHKVGDILTKQSGDIKKAIGEMQVNVAEEEEALGVGHKFGSENSQMNEITDAVSWEAVAAGMTAIGLAPLAINKLHQWWQKKHPESFKKAQGISAAMDRQAGNTPGQGNGVDTSKSFGLQNENKKKVIPKLNELRKQIKNK